MSRYFAGIKKIYPTLLADLFFLWVLFYFGLDGLSNAILLLAYYGLWSWALLAGILFLLLYRSDYRMDLPLFLAGLLLGYWGEWWGTTRGVWTYWNGATPPVYLPPLWGIGLLTVYRLSRWIKPLFRDNLPRWARLAMSSSFFILPALAFAHSLPVLTQVDWHGRLDIHFALGILITLVLILPQFDLPEIFSLYLCGLLLGGMYEYFGTSMGEWEYITHEIPPLWIAPLWGLAAAAMVRLAIWMRRGFAFLIRALNSGRFKVKSEYLG